MGYKVFFKVQDFVVSGFRETLVERVACKSFDGFGLVGHFFSALGLDSEFFFRSEVLNDFRYTVASCC